MALTEQEIAQKEQELKTREEELSKKEQASATAAFDPSKLTTEQLNKVLEDGRIFNTPRLKELRDKAKVADDLSDEKKKAEEEAAKKRGDYEKLLEEEKAKNAQLQESVKQTKIDNAIQAAAIKAGAVDPNVVGKLVDRSTIVIAEDGTITGADEAVTGLITASPYLKGNPVAPTVGAPSNPSPDTQAGQKTFKASQLNDPTFYRENEKEIDKAMKLGLIEDDLTPTEE